MISWLLYKYYSNDPCILADDMGLDSYCARGSLSFNLTGPLMERRYRQLGKTIQIISLLSIIFDRHGFFPFLIVVPNSTLENWVREFRKWAPRLVVVGYSARRPDKDIIKKHLLFAKKGKNAQLKFHVLVGTYEMAASELSTLKKAGPYEMLVVDEGQRLKADSTKLLESLNEVSVQHKVLLTGTPLQNNVRFLDAKTFPDPRALEKKYTNLDDQAVAEVKGVRTTWRSVRRDVRCADNGNLS
ncbi:MAG: LOW QUALITY PROTEIN: P-loop containing nucleoside triphosphate hydrolase protein [Olpidium bornovanus]|uniref:P-loop containing nucleoside triphosphate hydrolase protein n=1 Tax=Olpidium bornovanus TaxID=278681 RepID=A0A8H7ZRN8_9FUNG|nr:MAG: LOW QUALITY PROTEIN: P-loop containing nucleoside triphosphate hydrolase protein [Olpidium bornovanus]